METFDYDIIREVQAINKIVLAAIRHGADVGTYNMNLANLINSLSDWIIVKGWSSCCCVIIVDTDLGHEPQICIKQNYGDYTIP